MSTGQPHAFKCTKFVKGRRLVRTVKAVDERAAAEACHASFGFTPDKVRDARVKAGPYEAEIKALRAQVARLTAERDAAATVAYRVGYREFDRDKAFGMLRHSVGKWQRSTDPEIVTERERCGKAVFGPADPTSNTTTTP